MKNDEEEKDPFRNPKLFQEEVMIGDLKISEWIMKEYTKMDAYIHDQSYIHKVYLQSIYDSLVHFHHFPAAYLMLKHQIKYLDFWYSNKLETQYADKLCTAL